VHQDASTHQRSSQYFSQTCYRGGGCIRLDCVSLGRPPRRTARVRLRGPRSRRLVTDPGLLESVAELLKQSGSSLSLCYSAACCRDLGFTTPSFSRGGLDTPQFLSVRTLQGLFLNSVQNGCASIVFKARAVTRPSCRPLVGTPNCFSPSYPGLRSTA